MKYDYAIIVRDATRLEQLIRRFNTKAQAKFYVKSSGGNFLDYQEEHDVFHLSLKRVQCSVGTSLKTKLLDREHLTNFIFTDRMLVIVVGRDGLVANTAKYAGKAPVIGVNPAPERIQGTLLPFRPTNCGQAVENVLSGSYSSKKHTFAQVRLQDGQQLLAFNDLFIGARTHVSAHYRISYSGRTEQHSSSGIIVSTKAGATGWLSSICNMVSAISGHKLDLATLAPAEDKLTFAVREPYCSVNTQGGIVIGTLSQNKPLVIESLMPESGVIFSDGIERDFLDFNSGAVATILPSKTRIELVVN